MSLYRSMAPARSTIHAVNAVVRFSNVDTTPIPLWCSIVTKLVLGTTAALPGVCLSSAQYLEPPSSTRKIYPNTDSNAHNGYHPDILCNISVVLRMLSLLHITRLSTPHFASHLPACSSFSAPLFIRRLSSSVLVTTTVLIVTLFPALEPQALSYASFHPNFDVIYVVGKPEEVAAAQTNW
ncbi:hypothetical protein B0H14DRAFT_3446159 [Mycena olivaceomarginata]|nr:hypothetical protein B0H14DRAFT_3446159 [Mycena olivaceomarginata]